MMISWNTREVNKVARCKEINFRLFRVNPNIAILVETRMKKNNALILGSFLVIVDICK